MGYLESMFRVLLQFLKIGHVLPQLEKNIEQSINSVQ